MAVAALFFVTYESVKQALSILAPSKRDSPLLHVLSSSLAEVVRVSFGEHIVERLYSAGSR